MSFMEQTTNQVNAWNDRHQLFMIVLPTGTGLYFCWRTIVVQLRYIPEILKVIIEKPSDISEGVKGISAFKAFIISATLRVGIGSVAGVVVVIIIGGPDAVFWVWLLAAIGGATSFMESTLVQLYKARNKDSHRGGPAYYIVKGLGENWRWVASLFVVAITVTYGFMFNAVQPNSIMAAMAELAGQETPIPKPGVGIALAILAGVIIFGGVQRISAVTQIVVPIMVVAYIILDLTVLALNITEMPGMIRLIFEHVFGIREIAGAAVGTAMMQGIRRGPSSNEAGMGSTPNAAAMASVSHPVKQGLIQTTGVYFDIWVVCTIIAVTILLSDPTLGSDTEGTALIQAALSAQAGTWAVHAVTVVILFLALPSLVGNYYYTEANVLFLSKNKAALNTVCILVTLCVTGGAAGSVPFIRSLADTFSVLMATINITAILPLGGVAVALLRNYSEQKAKGLNPVSHRDDLSNPRDHGKIECWDGSDPMTVHESDVA